MAAKLTPLQLSEYHDTKQPQIIGFLTTFALLGNGSVIIRLFSQWRTSKVFHIEDYLIVLALLCSDLVIANYLVATHFGLGLHIWRIVAENPYNLIPLFKYQWVNSVFNGPTFLSIKLSILFFYKRMFIVHQLWLKIFWWANVVYNILWFFGSTAYFLFQCSPVEFYWERFYLRFKLVSPHPVSGQCNATSVSSVAIPLIIGLISDFALLVVPLTTLTTLKRSWSKRLALLAVFCVGLFACVLELVRIVIVEVRTDDATDPTYGIVDFIILTCGAEMIAITCACLPFIAALWRAQLDRLRSSRAGSSGQSGSGRGIRLSYLFGSRRNGAQADVSSAVVSGDGTSDASNLELAHPREGSENTINMKPMDESQIHQIQPNSHKDGIVIHTEFGLSRED